jgi:FMN-dependent NADH-azoreductase
MPRLLFIESSPRKARSASTEAAMAFIEAFKFAQPSAFVDVLDLWAKPLPEFDQAALDAKYAVMGGQSFNAPQKSAWAVIEQMTDRFKAADLIVFSVPMWNFGIPYKLKHYLDLIMQPGLTFGHDSARGYFGLVNDKKALTIYASGGEYILGTPAAEMDFQSRYLNFALNFLGIQNTHEIRVAPTMGTSDSVRAIRAAACARAVELAGVI